ncbi:MAG: hypothetical protein Q4G59_02560, partial [Planctomycetia bacterium]|nr:hypothetical protein [Planctomycetia bacterium]
MPNKLKIENKLSGRVVMVLAFAILALGIGSGSWVCAYGFGHTRGINPETGRPHGEQPINNTYDAGKVDANGKTLEPTKILKREVVPAVVYTQGANDAAKTAQGKPIVVATPVPARTPLGKTDGTPQVAKPEVKPAAPAQTANVAKPEVKPTAPA